MKRLLIIGAGGRGKVVAEVAEAPGDYESIDFADDNNAKAAGKISDLERIHEHYDSAFEHLEQLRVSFKGMKKYDMKV